MLTMKRDVRKVVEWRRRVKQQLVEYKGGECRVCGYNKCVEALDFHHIDESTKEFGLSGSTKSFERQKAESDKCVLLCSNCHRELHAGVLTLNPQ